MVVVVLLGRVVGQEPVAAGLRRQISPEYKTALADYKAYYKMKRAKK